ncbi:MAG: DUF2723 domain-containing protein [Bacteroidaceae bacterium]|nr:DUF2723 domain-containing protein [Bacteroidaceae bacterium]
MKQFKIINNAVGWIMFAVAAFVYCSTIESTASFWDCPEFITTAYKLEIGHPPGAPFFMLFGNLFTQFASDPSHVAIMINTMSALLSAACILFLFWTITHLVRKLICSKGEVTTTAQLVSIIGSGVVGALAYTFSDTFWFSAVEGEVYAFSSMFTALVFWLILKWEDQADQNHSDRWLVLIAYLMGLSIGVHLLNLLCIPAIVLIFYYKKSSNSNLKGSLLALLVSFVIIFVTMYGIIPGLPKVGGQFELFFTNVLGQPYNVGSLVYMALLIAAVIWSIYESYVGKNKTRMGISFLIAVAMLGIPFYGWGFTSLFIGVVVLAVLWALLFRVKKIAKFQGLPRVLNTTLLCFLMLMIGYSSYALIVIRSTANPPMDQGSPEDVFTLSEYLNRDQYGSTPLFIGPAYTSQVKTVREGDWLVPQRTKGAPIYIRPEKTEAKEKDSYKKIGNKGEYVYAQNMIFPRIWDEHHAREYESWLGGVKGRIVEHDPGNGQKQQIKMPTQWDNLRFFFSYQLNFMYWRYFMWNFAGRQNDIQGYGEAEHGNWISGIPFIDNLRLGDQSKLPDDLKDNKGHNEFYMLPLLLGLIGLFWQAYRGRKGIRQFWVVFFLFFMTGIAIVLYLNQTPTQPRERDYAYAGSFYAFAIWIGFGVAAIHELLRKVKVNETLKASVVSLACLLIPIQMGSQTWDDHDRSGRYTCRDFGQNYLKTLPEDRHGIIFTNGDNDTYPLWYNQETEGVGTQHRVCNLSYLQTEWYIDQMRRPSYEAPAAPITWNRADYVAGHNDYISIRPELKAQIDQLYREHPEDARRMLGDNPYELKNIIKHWVLNFSDPNMHVIPTDSIVLTVDKEAVKRSGMIIPDSIPDHLTINLKGRSALYKNNLMLLEMLSNANWERPMYFAVTVGRDNYLGLMDNFVQEGLAYRITPFNMVGAGSMVDVDKMYDNMMNKFRFGNISDSTLYLDQTVKGMCLTHRRMFAILADELLRRGDTKRALEVVERCEKEIPDYAASITNNIGGTIELARVWAGCGHKDKAKQMLDKLCTSSIQYLDWYMKYSPLPLAANSSECSLRLGEYIAAAQMMKRCELPDAETYLDRAQQYYQELTNRGIQLNFGN